ncbi:hypothetical protein BMS3Abin03_02297 [bacterium BMS3Abin03]|nr:hypothetical protein BMS3Abin03_02297 [bacterium BMS3Abin03]
MNDKNLVVDFVRLNTCSHYYYTQYAKDNEGKKKWEKGRWTDILMKKDGKWVMVGDHGGATK